MKGLEGLSGLSFFWHCDGLTANALEHLPRLAFPGIDGKLCDDEAMQIVGGKNAGGKNAGGKTAGDKDGLRMLLAQVAVATAAGYRSLSQSQTIEFIWGRLRELRHARLPRARCDAGAMRFRDQLQERQR